MNWSTAHSFKEGRLATSFPRLWTCGSGRPLWDPSGVSSLLFSNKVLAKWSKFNGCHIPKGFYENQNMPWQNVVGKCSRQKYALSVSEVALALGCFLLLYVRTDGEKKGCYGALWEDLLLITWLMGLLTKAPTFRIKIVSKRSCGEPHFPSLLLDTVSVSSLGEENI